MEAVPAVGPTLVQVDAAPVTLHVKVPAGAVAPTIPETVAVNVMASPNAGVDGEYVTAIVGVALATTTEIGEVVGRDAKFPSPK